MLHVIARHSLSVVEYWFLGLTNFWLAYTISLSSPSEHCVSMAFRTIADAFIDLQKECLIEVGCTALGF